MAKKERAHSRPNWLAKIEVLVDNIELNCWRKKKEKNQLRL